MTGEQPECERRHALHPAERQDGVGAGETGRVQDGGVHAAPGGRRRARDDVLHARHPGRGDTHDGRRDVRISSAGDVAAGGLDRDELLAGDHAGVKLGLELVHARELCLGEGPHLLVGERDVVLHPLRKGLRRPRDLVRAHHDVARPAVERLRVVPRPRFAAGLDVLQHRLDAGAGIVLAGGGGLRRLLQDLAVRCPRTSIPANLLPRAP